MTPRNDWRRDQPAEDQNGLAAEAIRPSAGAVVGERLRDAEHDDERQDCRPRGKRKFLFGNRREDAALDADRRPNERVDDDQERELRGILT